jgi:hypothetical protein
VHVLCRNDRAVLFSSMFVLHYDTILVGCGRTAPDPSGSHITSDGVEIPMGVGADSGVDNSSLLYNEYPLMKRFRKSISIRMGYLFSHLAGVYLWHNKTTVNILSDQRLYRPQNFDLSIKNCCTRTLGLFVQTYC